MLRLTYTSVHGEIQSGLLFREYREPRSVYVHVYAFYSIHN
jgi:hypothetical protein